MQNHSREALGDAVRLRASGVMVRACTFLAQTQQADGGWRENPESRILENGLVCLLSDRFVPELVADAERARHFLRKAPVQRHHPVPRAIDEWLSASVNGYPNAATLNLGAPEFAEPVYANRKLFFNAVALAVGSPVLGGTPRAELEARLSEIVVRRHESRLKSWSIAEVAALYLLLTQGRVGALTTQALDAIAEVQCRNGSFGENPISTVVATAALSTSGSKLEERRRAVEYLRGVRETDGTWRFSLADVWDTALLLRAFGRCSHLTPALFSRAESFIAAAQNPDGGFPYRLGVESDTDTTGMAMLALAGSTHAPVATGRAQEYLSRMRTDAGVWRTWHYRDDPPAEDAVAHAVLALKTCGAAEELWARATEWLAARTRADVGWRAHWYNIQAYAAHEIGLVLGRAHPATRYAAKLVMEQQNPDGGWGPTSGLPSTAAATGLATSLLLGYFPVEHPIVARAVTYLEEAQTAVGAWVGPTDMYAPRPFAVDYPFQTHALAAMGVVAVATKARPATQDRRRRRSGDDFLKVDIDQVVAAARPVAKPNARA
jgi:squalene-hopene/tetraprenyl-beta-curcumene cyclase